MADVLKSDYNELFIEDCKLYNDLANRYLKLGCEDGDEAYDIMKKSWAMAQRFSELSACSRKVYDFTGKKVAVTEYKDWCHERYSQMVKVHESARMIWGRCEEATRIMKRSEAN